MQLEEGEPLQGGVITQVSTGTTEQSQARVCRSSAYQTTYRSRGHKSGLRRAAPEGGTTYTTSAATNHRQTMCDTLVIDDLPERR